MRISILILVVAILGAIALTLMQYPTSSQTSKAFPTGPDSSELPATADTAVFAGGCFWCMEAPFEEIDGVLDVMSGYAGGHVENPTYEQVTSGNTGHAEVVRVTYDSDKVDYERLLDVYWRNIDPTTPNRQFCDVGSQYRPAIFYNSAAQRELAVAAKQELEASDRFDQSLAVEISALEAFYPAEEYHQEYYRKNPERYQRYRQACGRDDRLVDLWGDSE